MEKLQKDKETLQEKNEIINLKKRGLTEDSPLISVIIPAYNVDQYIKQCVDSVLTQTYRRIEVICIDDGSTDNTIPILEFLAQKDARVKLIKQSHQGVSAARNKGLESAHGKYISFVDSDDYLQWNSYEILTEVAEKFKLDLIIFGANIIGEAPEWIEKKVNTIYNYYPEGTAENVIFEEESARPFLWLHFIKRSLFEEGTKVRFNENMEMGEDQLCQFEYVPKAKSVMVIDDKLYNYRIGRTCSLMQLYEKQQMKKFNSHLILGSTLMETWKKQGRLNKNEDQVITWFTNLTYWSLITFPKKFQPKLAKQILNVIRKYNLKEYCISWYEKEHLNYIKDISLQIIGEDDEIADMEAQIKREEYEIQETLKSRAFKLGRQLTAKNERLNLSEYEMYI